MHFFKTEQFELQIKLETSAAVLKPGGNLNISINASPNSFVGLLGVDQSVLVLKKGNDIERSSVFTDLEAYNKADKINNIWISGHDSLKYKDFDASEMFMITNAKKEFGEIKTRLSFCILKLTHPQFPKAFLCLFNDVMDGQRGGDFSVMVAPEGLLAHGRLIPASHL